MVVICVNFFAIKVLKILIVEFEFPFIESVPDLEISTYIWVPRQNLSRHHDYPRQSKNVQRARHQRFVQTELKSPFSRFWPWTKFCWMKRKTGRDRRAYWRLVQAKINYTSHPFLFLFVISFEVLSALYKFYLIISGWEPTKDRNSTLYVRPLENTILMDPLTCSEEIRQRIDMVILQHSAPKNFDIRMANRFTWMKYGKQYEMFKLSSSDCTLYLGHGKSREFRLVMRCQWQ